MTYDEFGAKEIAARLIVAYPPRELVLTTKIARSWLLAIGPLCDAGLHDQVTGREFRERAGVLRWIFALDPVRAA